MRYSGKTPSEYLGIRDAVTALDFDLAVAYRMYKAERDEREDLANRIARSVSRMFFGGGEEGEGDEFGESEAEKW